MQNRPMQEQCSSALVRVYLQGQFVLEQRLCVPDNEVAYEVIAPEKWEHRKHVQRLLTILLSRPGRRARRSYLMDALWPETDPDLAGQYLNTTISKLRTVLRLVEGGEQLLRSSANGYKLASQEWIWVDTDAALALLQQAESETSDVLPLVEQAIAYLERGSFLEEEDGLWALGRRGQVDGRRHSAVLWLAELYRQKGKVVKAEALLRGLLEEDPADEDALCRLMELLHQQQKSYEALRCYEYTKALLKKEGIQPTAATRTVADRLRNEPGPLEMIPIDVAIQTRFPLLRTQAIEPSIVMNATRSSLAPILMHTSEVSEDYSDAADGYQGAIQDKESDPVVNRREITKKLGALGLALIATPGLFLDAHVVEQFSESVTSLNSEREILNLFEKLTEICWHLSKGNELAIAEQILWAYLPKVATLALPPSPQQQTAARIASQGYLLAASLAGHHNDLQTRQTYSEQALLFGNVSQDRDLQMAALRQLASTFDYQERPDKVLRTYQQAIPYLKEASPILRARIYAGISGAYAQVGQEQEMLRFLGLAYENFPDTPEDNPSFLVADCGYFTLLLWDGLNHLELHQPHKAEKAFAQIDGLQPYIEIPGRTRSEILTHQAATFAELRNLEQSCTYLEAAVRASLALGSQRRYKEAFGVFQKVQAIWHNEPQVKMLSDLFLT